MAEPIEKWRALDQTMAEVQSKFADLAPGELESLIDEALAALRKVRSFATAELSEERARAIGASRMDARHAHLDDMPHSECLSEWKQIVPNDDEQTILEDGIKRFARTISGQPLGHTVGAVRTALSR